MKKLIHFLAYSLLFSLFLGCSAALIPYTDNPYKLINQSFHLTASDRISVARRLLIKATSKIENNDPALQAYAKRANAFLLTSRIYQNERNRHLNQYNDSIDGKTSKAEPLYLEAIEIFTNLQMDYEASDTALLLALYYKGIWKYQKLCEAVKISKAHYQIANHKGLQKPIGPIVPANEVSFEKALEKMIKKYHCK